MIGIGTSLSALRTVYNSRSEYCSLMTKPAPEGGKISCVDFPFPNLTRSKEEDKDVETCQKWDHDRPL